ncbi:MAG: hypothetical protein ACK5BV_07505 [Bacteroidota bacterium]|jgi:hypothetical protein
MPEGIEPEVKDFLKRVMQTVSTGMLFLLVHMTFGLYLNWGFYENQIRIGNVVYYVFLGVSFAGLLYYYYKLWKDRLINK